MSLGDEPKSEVNALGKRVSYDVESSDRAADAAADFENALLPSSSAGSFAHKRLACAEHGFLREGYYCACGNRPYDIDNVDERNILTSLRGVARSARLTRARILCFPVAFLGLAAVFRDTAGTFILTPAVGEPLARVAELVLRRIQRPALRRLDEELLKGESLG